MRGKEFLEVPLSLLTENSRSGKMIAVNHQVCLCHYKKCRLIKIVEGENLDMTFPNAAVGVKKLFVAEILALIASACALVSGGIIIIGLIALSNDSAEGVIASGTGMMVTAVVSGVLYIIAFIMNLVGLAQASKDEAGFRVALYATISCIAFSVLGTAFVSDGTIQSLMTVLSEISNLMVTIYVIQGIRNLSLRFNNTEMDRKGNTLFKVISLVLLLGITANIMVVVFGGTDGSVAAAVFSMVSTLLSLVQYVLYLSYLGKAKKMLAEN